MSGDRIVRFGAASTDARSPVQVRFASDPSRDREGADRSLETRGRRLLTRAARFKVDKYPTAAPPRNLLDGKIFSGLPPRAAIARTRSRVVCDSRSALEKTMCFAQLLPPRSATHARILAGKQPNRWGPSFKSRRFHGRYRLRVLPRKLRQPTSPKRDFHP